MYGNVGRNDPCPCGSEKKFKKCCGSPLSPSSWPTAATTVAFGHPQEFVIRTTFVALCDYLQEHPIAGGCHLLSGVLHVLLAEQGVDSSLRMGEVLWPDGRGFDHSWVEIDGHVFDVAIQMTFDEQRHAPVYAGVNLGRGTRTLLKYGIRSTHGLDGLAQAVLRQPFVEYMDRWPEHPQGAWGIIDDVAKRLGTTVNIPAMRVRYATTQRIY